jgi:hypothetical protein
MFEDSPKSCPLAVCSLSFCSVAKVLVGVPALTIAAVYAGSLFEGSFLQLIAMASTVVGLVFLAVKIDRMPLLSKPIIKRD